MATNITIINFALIGLLAVIMALAATGAVELEVRTTTGPVVATATRRAAPKARKSGKLSGLVTDVVRVNPLNENPLERALREAGQIEDRGATVVIVGQVGIVIDHTSKAYQGLWNVLNGATQSMVLATGRDTSASRLPCDVAGIGATRYIAEWETLTFENIDLSGQYAEYIDVIATTSSVREVAREIEVPTPGYCLRCQRSVYRTGVELVYIPREGYYHSGHDLYVRPGEMDDLDGDPYYIPASTGTCASCGGNTMAFGSALTRQVLSSDYVSGNVADQPPTPKKPAVKKSRMLHADGYCMGCKSSVARRNVRLVTLDNRREATVGTCPRSECGQTVYRMGGHIDLDLVEQMNAITRLGYAFAYLAPRVVDARFAWGKNNIGCDLPGCFTFAARRGHRVQRVPGGNQLVHTTPAAFCEEHYAEIQQRYRKKAAGRAA